MRNGRCACVCWRSAYPSDREVSARTAEAALARLPRTRAAELARLLSPRRFEMPAEGELYRVVTPAASAVLKVAKVSSSASGSGGSTSGDDGSTSADGGSESKESVHASTLDSVRRYLRRLRSASLAAQRWAHATTQGGKERLARLSNPVYVREGSRDDANSIRDASGGADWATMICLTFATEITIPEAAAACSDLPSD